MNEQLHGLTQELKALRMELEGGAAFHGALERFDSARVSLEAMLNELRPQLPAERDEMLDCAFAYEGARRALRLAFDSCSAPVSKRFAAAVAG